MAMSTGTFRTNARSWRVTSLNTTVIAFLWFLLLLLAANGAAEELSTELEIEDLLFDKPACKPGLHKISVSENLQAPDIFNVRWKTTAAEEDIVVEVYREWSPLGADRFYQLILDNYYNCGAFFRVVPDFVVQFGIASDPEETSKWGNSILDDPVTQSNLKGTITYATGGPNTRTTQLFINLQDNSSLDRQGFSPFGKVVSGINILTTIYNPTPGKSGGADQGAYEENGNEWIIEKYPDIDMIENTALFEGVVGSGDVAIAEEKMDDPSEEILDASYSLGRRCSWSLLSSIVFIIKALIS